MSESPVPPPPPTPIMRESQEGIQLHELDPRTVTKAITASIAEDNSYAPYTDTNISLSILGLSHIPINKLTYTELLDQYAKLSLAHHPDSHPETAHLFQSISNAYVSLTNHVFANQEEFTKYPHFRSIIDCDEPREIFTRTFAVKDPSNVFQSPSLNTQFTVGEKDEDNTQSSLGDTNTKATLTKDTVTFLKMNFTIEDLYNRSKLRVIESNEEGDTNFIDVDMKPEYRDGNVLLFTKRGLNFRDVHVQLCQVPHHLYTVEANGDLRHAKSINISDCFDRYLHFDIPLISGKTFPLAVNKNAICPGYSVRINQGGLPRNGGKEYGDCIVSFDVVFPTERYRSDVEVAKIHEVLV